MAAEPTVDRRHAARAALFAAHRRDERVEWIQAGGDSMRPAIAPGSWMQVRFGAEAHLGDVVVLTDEGRHVAHRVVALREGPDGSLVITKGDGEPYCDRAVPVAAIAGVVGSLAARPGARATSTACASWATVPVARVSHAIGRIAGRARRAARRLPAPLRAPVVRATGALSAGASKLSAALLLGAARVIRNTEGG